MENRIYNEQNGLWYELQGEYYLPCLLSLKDKISLWAYGDSDTHDT